MLGWLLYFIVFVVLVSFIYASLKAAPWVPMRAEDLARVIAMAKIKPGEKFFDLGAGDGRTLEAAEKNGAEAVGYEISLLPFLLSFVRKFFVGAKFKMLFKDLWKADLQQADIVFFFLMPKIFPRLQEKLEKELRPGTRVISYVWPINGWAPETINEAESRPKLYLYHFSHSRKGGN
jgi:SAM-dependent methyltransferase